MREDEENDVMPALQTIQREFDLPDCVGGLYFLKNGEIWEQTPKITRPKPCPEEGSNPWIIQMKRASSLNVVAYKVWSRYIMARGVALAKKKLQDIFSSDYPGERICFFIMSDVDESMSAAGNFYFFAPKRFVFPNSSSGRCTGAIVVSANQVGCKLLLQCRRISSQYYQMVHEYAFEKWKEIDGFIRHQSLNQKLGLKDPPFSMGLYGLVSPPYPDMRHEFLEELTPFGGPYLPDRELQKPIIFNIGKEQEDRIAKELQAIREKFNLDERRMLRLSWTPQGECISSSYSAYEGALWIRQAWIGWYSPFEEKPPTDEAAKFIDFYKESDCLNKVVVKFWGVEIGVEALKYAKRRMAELLAKDDPDEELVYMEICNYETEQDSKGKLSTAFYAPRSFLARNNISQWRESMWGVEISIGALEPEFIKRFMSLYNRSNQIAYEYELKKWWEIHEFICDQRMNERLGLKDPLFTMKLYEINYPRLAEKQWIFSLYQASRKTGENSKC